MAIYLNTYETWQAYGGPEEGGWWFECGTPVQSLKVSEENLEWLREKREERREILYWRKEKLWDAFRKTDNPAMEERLLRIIDKVEAQESLFWTKGRLPELNRMANEINKVFAEEREIAVKCKETGGYQFVVSSPDDEDPTPSAYYGEQKYVTNVEDDFAAPFPSEKPHYE